MLAVDSFQSGIKGKVEGDATKDQTTFVGCKNEEMKDKGEWIKRRWLDFRQGHSVYLIFAIQFVQFTIISYTLAIERFPFLEQYFPSMGVWVAFFLGIYIPLAILIGDLHLKRQLKREVRQQIENNPFTFYATPGKESKLGLPSSTTGLKVSSETITITNDIADTMETLYDAMNRKLDLGLPEKKIKRYSHDLVEENAKWIYINEGLINGGHIDELLKKWDQARPTENNN